MGTEIEPDVPGRHTPSRRKAAVASALRRILGSAAALAFVMAILALQFRRFLD